MRTAAYVLLMATAVWLWQANHSLVMSQSVWVSEPSKSAPMKRIKLPVSLKEEGKIQTAVDEGHQPWRLVPLDVAYAALAAHNFAVSKRECTVDKEDKTKAMVICKRAKTTYHVMLEKLVRADGIWTARIIEIFDSD